MKGFREANLKQLICEVGEDRVKEILSDFSCPKNLDVEDFLRNKATIFVAQGIASVFLVFASFKGEVVLVGYYALANKSFAFRLADLNSKWRRRLNRFATFDPATKNSWVALPLIGQLGKNFANGYNKLISGDELLKLACDRIINAQLDVGGKLAYLECEDRPPLIDFYERNGFYRFANRNLDKDEIGEMRYLVQMIRYFE